MNIPTDFLDICKQFMSSDLVETLLYGLEQEPPVSVRLNPFKGAQPLNAAQPKVPWCTNGLYLDARPNFTFDPLMHAGLYYVQEASSMFVDFVLRQLIERPVQVLDLCAAPGGKSTCALSALPDGSTLISNEPVKKRASVLLENMLKFGHSAITVTSNYAHDFAKAHTGFDVIIADVPCSGEGMFRKDDRARVEWSMQNVEKCAKLQREIVSDIWPCLSPGGYMLYSTCTLNIHENEENVAWICKELGAEAMELPIEKEWNITNALTGTNPVYRFIPGKTQGEGFFMAVLRKKEMGHRQTQKIKDALPRGLNVLNKLSEEKAKIDLFETYRQVLSVEEFMHRTLPGVAVDYPTAIQFLRREALTLPYETEKGIQVLTYKNAPLGIVKNIGNRANNLYPAEWKIKTTHIATEIPEIILPTINI